MTDHAHRKTLAALGVTIVEDRVRAREQAAQIAEFHERGGNRRMRRAAAKQARRRR